eukprot:scaffold196808_cov42-Prasinocladus_malaysianus.AAC.1
MEQQLHFYKRLSVITGLDSPRRRSLINRPNFTYMGSSSLSASLRHLQHPSFGPALLPSSSAPAKPTRHLPRTPIHAIISQAVRTIPVAFCHLTNPQRKPSYSAIVGLGVQEPKLSKIFRPRRALTAAGGQAASESAASEAREMKFIGETFSINNAVHGILPARDHSSEESQPSRHVVLQTSGPTCWMG